jgi:hypothetical protein
MIFDYFIYIFVQVATPPGDEIWAQKCHELDFQVYLTCTTSQDNTVLAVIFLLKVKYFRVLREMWYLLPNISRNCILYEILKLS